MDPERSIDVVQKEIEAALDELATLECTQLTSGEVADYVGRSHRIRARADAHCIRAAGLLDTSKVWSIDGAKSASAWIAWRCHVPKGRASAATVTARSLRDMPIAETALLAGHITGDHVRRLAEAQQVAPEAYAAAGGEDRLVEVAQQHRFDHFERVLRYWMHYAAPDAEEAKAAHRRDERHLSCSRTFEGTVVIEGILDPVNGEIFARELERLERELFDDDLAEARERVGAQATLQDLRRSPRQRRADALARMAERSAAKPADATEARVLLHVLTGHESVERMCELSNGTVLTPGEVLPVLHRADVERVIFDGPSKVLDVGVRQRLFRAATRTAIELRDRRCTHPSCDVPFDRCEIDHIVPYEAGGLTTQANGRCLCPYHHRRARPSP